MTAPLAWVMLLTVLAIPNVPAAAAPEETFADDFQTSDFTGSTGSLPWSTSWLESGEADGSEFGAIGVWNEPHCATNPCLVIGRVSGTDATVEREADLSGFASATLSFNYKVHSHTTGAGFATLQASDDGGASWATLDTWSLATDTAQLVGSYDLTPFMAGNTRILFGISNNIDDSHLNIDDLVITASGRQGYFDQFPDPGWDGSTGSLDWSASPWVESEGDSWDSGLIQVIADSYCTGGNCLRIEGSASSADHSVVRHVDLTGSTFASLLFNYRRETYNTCSVRLEIYDEDEWEPLATYGSNGGDTGQQSEALDISGYATADTQIRFSSNGTCTPGEFFYADNIWVYTDAAPSSNQAPLFDQDLPNRSDPEGTLINISAAATDPDVGDTLAYSATGLPDGIAIDPGTGLIKGALSPNSAGVHAVTLTVTDNGAPSRSDTDSFTWTITPGDLTYLVANWGGANGGNDLLTAVDRTNPDPVTNEVDIGTGTGTTNVEAAATQPGTNALFVAENDQLGTIDVTTGVFAPKPSPAGVGSGSAGLISFSNIEGLTFDPFQGDLYATHGRGLYEEDLLFRIDPLTGSHVPGAFAGDDYVLIESRDGNYHAADIAFDPTDGQLYVVHWTFDNRWSIATLDPATGDTATIGSAPDNIAGLAFDESGRMYASTNTGGTERIYELSKIDASVVGSIDIDNGSNYEAIAIAFPVDPNQAPVFDQDLLDRTDPEGTTVLLSAAATDPDGHDIKYSATGLPPGLSIEPVGGVISGTIDFAATGNYAVEIVATDDGIPNLSSIDAFTWTVSELNRAPVFDQDLPDRSDAEGDTVSFSASATDPDAGDSISYGASGLPPGVLINPSSGLISGVIDHTAADGSPYAVTITATDDGLPPESAVPDTFTWTVANTNRAPVMDNPGPQTTPELSPFTLVVTASDPDGTTPSITDAGTLPAWASLTDNGDGTATITGTPGIGGSGTTTVTVTAADGTLTDDAVFDITVTNTNVAPTIVNPGNQTGNEGSPFTVVVTASDPDGTTVGFTDSGTLPAWATLFDNGDNTASISGTPGYDDAGTTTVTITASDGTLPDDAVFDIIIADTNRPPVVAPITDQTVAEGEALVPVVASASDPDGSVPSLSAAGLPPWASFVDNGDGTGTITGTPGYDDAGMSTVTVYGEDGGTPNLTDSTSFAITVDNTNRAPALSPIADQTVAEGDAMTPLTVTASDPDGTVPSLAAAGLPPWASFVDNGDGTGTLSGTPGPTDAGVSTVTITAADGGLTDEKTFDLTVTEGNLPPVFKHALPNRIDAEGDTVSIDAAATDPNGDDLSYSAAGLPPGMAINPGTGLITGTLPYSSAGAYAVSITVVDDGIPALSAGAGFTWTIADTNRAPVLAPILPVLGPEMTELMFTAAAADPDGDDISYSVAGAPPGAAIDPATGVFTWTPDEVHGEGSYAVTVVATDSGVPAGSDATTVTITVAEANRPPIVDRMSDQQNEAGDSVDVQIVAVDPDVPLNSLTYRANGLPPGLTIDSATGAITGTIAAGAAGTYTITVTVTDDGEPRQSGTTGFKWVVGDDTNHPPVMDRLDDRTVAELSPVIIQPNATDPDGDSIRYEVTGAPPGSSFDPVTGMLRWTPSEEQGPGNYRLSIIAVDNGDPELIAVGVLTINVTEVNSAPTIEAPLERVDDAGDTVSMQIVATDPDAPANDLSYAATDLPPGLAIDPTTGIIGGQIETTTVEVTHYATTVTVVDDGDPALEATTTFTWTVVGAEVVPENFPPRVDPIAARFTDAGSTVELQVHASDTGPLTFSAEGLPDGLTIDPAIGLISGTVAVTAVGTHPVVITVADNAEPPLRTAVSFAWTVTDRAAADQKDDVVVTIVDIGPESEGSDDDSDSVESRPLRRGLVVMSTAAAATTEPLRLPFALLLALMAGFATIGRIGLYPLLWRGERHAGTITFYDDEIGFGLIHPDEGGETVFVHAHAFPRRQRAALTAGLRLRYRVLAGDNRSSAWGATVAGENDE